MTIEVPDLVRRLKRRAISVRLCARISLRLGHCIQAADMESDAALMEESAEAIELLFQSDAHAVNLHADGRGADQGGGGDRESAESL